MEVQPQLVLLQKTLLNVEGLGRQLYPELDLWSTAQPFLENWMRGRIGPAGLLKSLKTHLPEWIEQSPEMPQLVHDALLQLRHSGPSDSASRQAIELLRESRARADRRWRRSIAALALVGIAWLSIDHDLATLARALPAHGWLLLASATWLVAGIGRKH
jgi:ubiquinone biosynthesis protein